MVALLILRLCVLSNVQPLCSSNHPSCNQTLKLILKFSKIKKKKKKRNENPLSFKLCDVKSKIYLKI